ncbi:MAG: D-aminoacyl-tRNA deacylase, partial [Candidatus Bathyarchaeota archaeon]
SDPAGLNILNIFKEIGFIETEDPNIFRIDGVYLIVVEPLIVPEVKYKIPKEPDPYPIDYDGIAKALDLEYIVVASRHWARSGQPSLTVHPTGNFGKAVYGGKARELQVTFANPMRDVYLRLLQNPPKGFEVSLEATHHSPTQFSTPMFFAELGSRKRQWMEEEPARYLATAILKGIKDQGNASVAIGFGGGHYCPTFSVLEEETAFGHIAAKYALDLLTPELISQMVEKTFDGVQEAILDKGLKGYQKKKVEVALRNLDIEIREQS